VIEYGGELSKRFYVGDRLLEAIPKMAQLTEIDLPLIATDKIW